MGKNWESTTLLTLLTDVLASFSNFPVLQIIYASFEAELYVPHKNESGPSIRHFID